MKLSFVLASTAATLLAAPAVAQDSGWYADAGYQFVSVDQSGVDADIGNITGHVGYNFTPNFGVEGELGFGVNDEEFDVLGATVDVGLNYLVGAYGRLQAPIGENVTVFARAGIVNAELEVDGAGITQSASDTGAGYGVGGEWHFDGKNGIRADYTRYDIEDLEADAVTIAYSRKF